jgi:hypothetical protein
MAALFICGTLDVVKMTWDCRILYSSFQPCVQNGIPCSVMSQVSSPELATRPDLRRSFKTLPIHLVVPETYPYIHLGVLTAFWDYSIGTSERSAELPRNFCVSSEKNLSKSKSPKLQNPNPLTYTSPNCTLKSYM